MKAIRFLMGLVLAAVAVAAHAVTMDTISANVNGMRQLSTVNIVQRGAGVAPYYGPAACQQQLGAALAKVQAFDPAYTCSCPSATQPPSCSGPAHFPTAAISCSPETPFDAGTPAPWGGSNPQAQDWALNYAEQDSTTTCDRYGHCTTTALSGYLRCTASAAHASVAPTATSCAAVGLTPSWLTTYAGWGKLQVITSAYGASYASNTYPNVCVAAVAPLGTPAPQGWAAPTAANPLAWPYVQVPCDDVGLPASTTSSAAETCQVVQATCAPTYVEGYAYPFGGVTSLTGTGLAVNPAPAGYAGWSGPLMQSTQVGGGADSCQARFACTGQQQTQIPFEAMCTGSKGGDTGWHLGSLIIPTGAGNYPNTPPGGIDYATTMVGPNWGCSGAYTGAMVPVTANIQCDGAICYVSLDIASSGSCSSANQCGGATWVTTGDGWSYPNCPCGQAWSASTGACVGHVTSMRWTMIRQNYAPQCPNGLTYVPASKTCQTTAP